MTDKEKIREEVVRMHNLLPIMDGDNIYVNYADRICTTLEMYIDSLQEEPVSKEIGDYDHKAVMESLHPELKEDNVSTSIDFEQKLYKNFGQVKDFTLAVKIAKKFYEMGKLSNVQRTVKNCKETVSEELEKVRRWWINKYSKVDKKYTFDRTVGHFMNNETIVEFARYFANWQKEKDEHLIWQLSSANYEKGKQEVLKDLPEWKIATEDLLIGCLVWDEFRHFHLYSDRVSKGELYISMADILRLPGSPKSKEE